MLLERTDSVRGKCFILFRSLLNVFRVCGGASESVVEVVDRCIANLLAVKSMRPGTEVNLPGADITTVVQRAREVFLAQPMLLEVRDPYDDPDNLRGRVRGRCQRGTLGRAT